MKKIFIVILSYCITVFVLQAQNFTAGNLALFVTSNSSNNTTGSVVEINTTTVSQPAINTFSINGTTGPNSLRFSGSATSTGYLALSNDKTLLCFTGGNTTTTGVNLNTITNRGVGTLNSSYVYNLGTTYTGTSGNQTRCATSIDNSTWYIADQGGVYTNLASSASPTGNLRGMKSFGGIVYCGQQSSSAANVQVSTISAASGGTITGLPGLTNSASFQDFYLVSSGVNGTTYDILYVTEATSATVGVITKYSLVSGSWVSNGTYATTFGGFGLAAEVNGGGANLYVSTGNGATAANSVIKLNDVAGYNSTLSISTPSNVTLFTTAAGTTIKGVSMAPIAFVPPPTPTVAISLSANAGSETGVTVITVTATASTTLPTTETVNVGVTGTGITAGDYSLSNSIITINSGTNSGSVTFTVVDDALIEGTETAIISISSPSSGLTLGTPTSDNVTITDNDLAPPTVHFTSLHQSVLENAGTASVGFTMTSSPNASACKIIVTTSVHTTATSGGVDYTISNDTITFPASSSSPQSLSVNINDDAIAENAEYVSFKVASIINGTLGSNQYHILYIRDNDYTPPTPTNEVMLQLLGSFSNGSEGTNSAEIVAYDSASQKLVIANSVGGKVDFVDFSNPASPSLITSINITPMGNVNSVAVRDGIVAVALENLSPQSNGKILFYNTSGVLISQVDVGAMPDMVTFNHSGNKVLVACEGEPNNAYTIDPEGTVGVVDISGGVASVTNANVTMINFNAYDSQVATLRASGVRIYGPSATVSQDFEPEYITVSDDDLKAWVVLQENNAMAVVDLITNTVTQILPLGTANHMLTSNGMDASDQSTGINIANYPVKGMYLPDGLTHINIGGTNYLITANEGDSRAWSGMNEESRISALSLDPTVFVDQNILKSNFMLGRLNATTKTGDTDNDGDIDEIYVYGARGFSIWTETGTLVYNSGNLMEKIIASHPMFAGIFNANHAPGAIVTKNRSDDKGTEPEGVAVATIDGDVIAFVSCERLGGVFLFNIDNPASPRYVGYYNNRSIPGNNPDRGAEGIIYINAAASPNGNDILILANEVSSTLSIFQVNTCASLSGVDVNFTPDDTICSGQSVTFSTPVGGSTNLQWLMNNSNISGETGTSTSVTTSGYFSLAVQNTSLGCADTTEQTQIVVNSLPIVSGNVTDDDFCNGASVTFTGSGANTYLWTGGVTDGSPVSPSASGTYTVTGTAINGCTNTATVSINVYSSPSVIANVTSNNVCTGDNVTFTGSGATSYTWTGGVSDAIPFTPSGTATYTVTGTDANSCSSTATVSVTVNNLPTVVANVTDDDFCDGTTVSFTGSGATSYTWSGSVNDNIPTNPSASGTYTVTGTDGNGCSNTATITITVHSLPPVIANVTDSNICIGSSVTFNGGGGISYTWTGGVNDGVLFTPSGTQTYTVTGTDANTCTNTSIVTVTVNNLPTIGANVTDNNICEGDNIVFTGSGASTYLWTGGVVNGSSFTPTATATYTVTGTDVNSCSATATVSVTVNNLPTVSLSINPTSYCLNASPFTLTGGLPTGGVFAGSGVSGSQFDPATGLGTYVISYTYTDANGCSNSATDNLSIIGCAGIENESISDVVIYPNPSENYFYIKTTITEVLDIRIIDLHGKIIYTAKVSSSEMIDISNYAAGAYVVELIYKDEIFRSRLIKK